MKRQVSDAVTSHGVFHIVRRMWCQRGLTVWQVAPNRPTQSNVGLPGCGVVVVWMR